MRRRPRAIDQKTCFGPVDQYVAGNGLRRESKAGLSRSPAREAGEVWQFCHDGYPSIFGCHHPIPACLFGPVEGGIGRPDKLQTGVAVVRDKLATPRESVVGFRPWWCRCISLTA